MGQNRLADEDSPYLLQHKDNPVHWQPWGEEAFALARQTGRPVLLSIGYAACHWCHVMAHESFEDNEIADQMNRDFVCIKLDREERPDIDGIYQTALQLTGGQGGWPLTMFLTEDKEPFWGGAYFPKTPRFGLPGFREVLTTMARGYHENLENLRHNIEALRRGLARQNSSGNEGGDAPQEIDPALLDQVAEDLATHMDMNDGGLRGAPKFPQTPLLELLWRAWIRTGREDYRDCVTITLRQMCAGGIYDHLGGGFARYATDEAWLVPHFEKMLYDNAQLLELMGLVWRQTGDPVLETRMRETVNWLIREMALPGGGFAASLDADSLNQKDDLEEGAYYVWDEDEIDTLLGTQAAAFKTAYGVHPGGNWEGHTILNRLHDPENTDDTKSPEMVSAHATLLAAREKRVPPARDDKLLADWNGLIISGLITAGEALDKKDWIKTAEKVFAHITAKLTTANGRLAHVWTSTRNEATAEGRAEGRARHPATLDDYANLMRAAAQLFEATGNAAYLIQINSWIAILEHHYRDQEGGGYYFAANDTTDLIIRTKTAHDHATPSGNGVLAQVFAKLYGLTGKDEHHRRASEIIAAFWGNAKEGFPSMATLLNGAEDLFLPLRIVITGPADKAATKALQEIVRAHSLPGAVILTVADTGDLPDNHPAYNSGSEEGVSRAYVCRGTQCSLPLTTPETLRVALNTII
ncbi:MAG: thioredoxin domain-containing protein [Rhodospirillaceae bacterium]|nr:thioredoxin domain-containing protein [Rhodospirillaceae bacterium]MBT5658849.1 thioredoxin domain-containing protein [Rhodospirillaceae bacterium]MBT5751731.1 thioredoxin domain-containing protein [Rhodospirillaceae bacterium]